MLLIVAIALAQNCSVTDSISCPGPISSPRFQGYIFEPYGSAAGVAMQSHREPSDQSADVTLQCKQSSSRDGETPAIEYTCGGVVPFRVLNNGSVQAGSQSLPGTSAAFVATGDVSALGCNNGAWGCATIINGGMMNQSRHGAVTLGNAMGVQSRDGGLALQVFATGRAMAPNRTVLEQDVFGNLETYEGLHGSLVSSFPVCESTGGWTDEPGRIRTLGMSGYDVDHGQLHVCTSASAVDGGWETVTTDRSLAAALAIINARLTALEAR